MARAHPRSCAVWFSGIPKEAADISSTGAPANGNDWPYIAAIALWGDFVTFASGATNLVPGDTNNTYDVFRRGPLH